MLGLMPEFGRHCKKLVPKVLKKHNADAKNYFNYHHRIIIFSSRSNFCSGIKPSKAGEDDYKSNKINQTMQFVKMKNHPGH